MAGLTEINAAQQNLAAGLSTLAGSVAANTATVARLANDRLAPSDGDAIVTQLNDATNQVASLQAQLDASNASAPA